MKFSRLDGDEAMLLGQAVRQLIACIRTIMAPSLWCQENDQVLSNLLRVFSRRVLELFVKGGLWPERSHKMDS